MIIKGGPIPFDIKPPMAYDEKNEYGVIIPRVIDGFPYPQRNCPFCERILEILNAVHLQGDEEIFKALMICRNPNCGVYDEPAKTAYLRVYYSSELALETFETTMLRTEQLKKD